MMRLFIYAVVFALAIISVHADQLQITSILLPDQAAEGESFPVYVRIEPEEGFFAENVKVRAFLLDSGGFASDGRFDLAQQHNSYFDLTADSLDDWALIRVSVTGNGIKRIKHRWISLS